MDQPANRLSVISVRLSILTVRRPVPPVAWRPELPAGTHPRPALLPVGRPARTGRRGLAIAGVLAAAVVLFATVPVWIAHQVIDSRIWEPARHLPAAVARPDLSSHALPLLLGAIVVLAAMSSSSRPRDRGHW
jgi:hypothetical protein